MLKTFAVLIGFCLLIPGNLIAAGDPTGGSGTLASGDNLVVQGIPPIASTLVEDVGRYTEFRGAGFASWHPQRREMLISTRLGDVPQVHVLKFPGGARIQLTFGKEPASGGSFQKKDGSYLLYSQSIGGNEQYQKYRYDLESGQTTLLTDGKSRNIGGVWSNAGDQIAYGSTRRNGKDVDLYVMNPADPTSNHMVAQLQGGGWGAVDWSPDDKQLLVVQEESINESYLWVLDLQSGEKKLITPHETDQKIAYGAAQFSRDGRGLYLTTDRNSEFQRLAYMDLATGKLDTLTDSIPWDIEDFDLSRDGKTLALVSNEDGISVLRLLDTETKKLTPLPQVPQGVIGGIKWHHNNRDLAFTLSSARSPSDVYSLDKETGKIERWTFSETGGLNPSNFSEPQLIRWKSFDDRAISGFLYRPPAKFTGKRPVVILVHGGPEAQARPGFMSRYNYLLNEMGVALIQPNIRGSAGYGKSFLQLDNGILRDHAYKDIGALFDWIQTQGDLDPSRVMITGGSYGGNVTLAIATLYPDRIRCALDVVGPSNLVTFLEHTSGYRQDLRRAEYGDERDPKVREYLESIAPLNHADRITNPLFVVQGGNDPRVPASEADQMVQKVRAHGTPVWYLLAKDEGHGFAKKPNADFQFYATVLFMRNYLLN
jgi:dipeptidyl aminopeptidase/acylaminoacyl peptidase